MRKVHVTPGGTTRLQAKVGIGVASAFLVFGLVFGAVISLEDSGSEPGLVLLRGLFFLIWAGVCIAMIVSFARVLSGKGAPADRSLVDLHVEGAEDAPAGADFEARLRKLEALRRDRLVSEDEYRAKREEILREKW